MAIYDPLPLLYRDDRLIAVAKPSGLPVHRGWSRERVVALTLARDRLGRRVYPVHRLDQGTSGVLLFALDSEAARRLQEQLAAGTVRAPGTRSRMPDGVSTSDAARGRRSAVRRSGTAGVGTFERYSLAR